MLQRLKCAGLSTRHLVGRLVQDNSRPWYKRGSPTFRLVYIILIFMQILKKARIQVSGPLRARDRVNAVHTSAVVGSRGRNKKSWREAELSLQSNSDYDVIMVLGGGLTFEGGFPEWVHRRLDAALHFYQVQG